MTTEKKARPEYIDKIPLELARRTVQANIDAHTLDIWELRSAEYTLLETLDALAAENEKLKQAYDSLYQSLDTVEPIRKENERLKKNLQYADETITDLREQNLQYRDAVELKGMANMLHKEVAEYSLDVAKKQEADLTALKAKVEVCVRAIGLATGALMAVEASPAACEELNPEGIKSVIADLNAAAEQAIEESK